jgi:hypothetical protein
MLGWPPAVGVAVSLVLRARDVSLGLVGLSISGVSYRSILFPWGADRERKAAMQMQTGRRPFGPVQIGIVLSALATALIHWVLVGSLLQAGLDPTMFILNGLGYVALAAALFAPGALVRRFLPDRLARFYRPAVRYTLMAYTLLTILLWGAVGMRSPIGYITKAFEVALLIFLWLDRSRA